MGLTNKEPEKTFEEMMVAIGDSLSDLASSDDGEDGEDASAKCKSVWKLHANLLDTSVDLTGAPK